MEEIKKCVKEILTTNEVVCLPGLGGFISKHVSSNYDQSTHIFTPPHKQIAFNERLINDSDNLLLLISERKRTSKETARIELSAFVEFIKSSLQKNKEFNFTGLGLLYFQENGSISFKADISPAIDPFNFGLPQILIKFSPIETPNKFLQKPKDRKAMSTIDLQSVPDPGSPGDNPQRNKNDKKEKSLVWLYIITPIILIGGMAMFLAGTDDGRKVLANMHIMSTPMPADSVFSDSAINQDMIVEEPVIDSSAIAQTESFDNAVSAEETIKKTETQTWGEEPVKSKQEEIAKTDVHTLAVANLIKGKSGRCFVIAGGFSNRKNAIRFREKLVQEGLESKIIAPAEDGSLYRVSLGDYAEKTVAIKKAEELKPTYGENIWVMIY
ncbi:MAG: SPOR domain-containing protein [Opitutaceae bacterium]|nr:SPOR domain-containing protein [Cytophagales bacterium]